MAFLFHTWGLTITMTNHQNSHQMARSTEELGYLNIGCNNVKPPPPEWIPEGCIEDLTFLHVAWGESESTTRLAQTPIFGVTNNWSGHIIFS